MTVFETLNALNVNEHTERKVTDGGKTSLTYLSWPWAWAEVKKRYPDAHYTVVKDGNGLPYFSDPRTGIMVYTNVTIDGITHEMWLPVMDSNNKAMRFEPYEIATKFKTIQVKAATMFDVNKTIMRCLTKNLAMFGLGLYIYAGEDLPEGEDAPKIEPEPLPADALQPGEKIHLPPAGSWNPRNAVGIWCKKNGVQVTDFGKMREALIAGGIVPDIKSGDLTPEQFDDLIHAMEANYPDQLRKPA